MIIRTVRVLAHLYLVRQFLLIIAGRGGSTLGSLLVEAPLLLLAASGLVALAYDVVGDERRWISRHALALNVLWLTSFGIWFWAYSESPFTIHEYIGTFSPSAMEQARTVHYLWAGLLFLLCVFATSGLWLLDDRTKQPPYGAFDSDKAGSGSNWMLLGMSMALFVTGMLIWFRGLPSTGLGMITSQTDALFSCQELFTLSALSICSWLICCRARSGFWLGIMEVVTLPVVVSAFR